MGSIVTNPPPRRCSPAAGIFAFGVACGAALATMLVMPIVVHEVRGEVQAAWDADVHAFVDREQAAYEQGRADAEALAALEKEEAQ